MVPIHLYGTAVRRPEQRCTLVNEDIMVPIHLYGTAVDLSRGVH